MKFITRFSLVLLAGIALSAAAASSPGTALAQDGESELSVNDAQTALGVEERQPVDAKDTFEVGDKVVLWMSVKNGGEETQITVVWKRDGSSIWETTLKVGRSQGWKTWARKTIRTAGSYSVDIQDPNGETLKTVSFTVTE